MTNHDEVVETKLSSGIIHRIIYSHHEPCIGPFPCKCDPIKIDEHIFPKEDKESDSDRLPLVGCFQCELGIAHICHNGIAEAKWGMEG